MNIGRREILTNQSVGHADSLALELKIRYVWRREQTTFLLHQRGFGIIPADVDLAISVKIGLGM